MNFIWLDINSSWSHSSLALPALHANLSPATADACNMQVVRGTIKSPVAQVVQQVAQLDPTYIFATGWLFNINYLNEVLCRVSALCSPLGIFLGGPEFLGDNSEFLHTHPHITAVFKGEGEEMFHPFINSLLRRDSAWRDIPGFEYITNSCDNSLYHSSTAVSVKNFKDILCPEESPLFSWDKSFVQIETSRGCFNTCRFCVSGIEKCPIQDIPIDGLRSRLENIYNHGVKQIRVLDRTFNGNPRRALQLLDLFKEFANVDAFPICLDTKDVEEIIRGLQDGTIDVIATDHAPHSEEEKSRPLVNAPSGAVGLETSLALTLTALYHTKQLTLPEVIRRMSTNPADILGLPKGRMSIGVDADLVIFDPDEQWVVDPAKFASKGRNTPFAGWEVFGKCLMTVCGGKIAWKKEDKQ